mmetsp:Transcript_14975/g.21359  ORF Transcript_14975/g.21359 Transcript_14975/m.21359 type:complete len:110 (+) Transcript_14975:190-519(+)
MTYRSRGRTIFELVVAFAFTAFLIGFIAVLCIGNYFRAKRAQERQRQRRLTKQGAQQTSTQVPASLSSFGSPRSTATGAVSQDQESAFSTVEPPNGTYEAPKISSVTRA